MRVLLTGGAGYIGSHTLVELLALGHQVCVVDNYANSAPEALTRVRQISNRDFRVEEGDIRDRDRLTAIFTDFRPEAVIHFAGLKAVGEGEEKPVAYYDTNVTGTLVLLEAMRASGCGKIIFSSSATVYGNPLYLPYDEAHPCSPTNVYGRTKYMAEQVLADWVRANPGTGAVLLRYFNPVGAHVSGRIGEDPQGIPNNLLPFIAQVAVGRRAKLAIFGDDYDTRDGTGLRDYIHVADLARAHALALDYAADHTGTEVFNIGTGTGTTVKEMLAAFERACGHALAYEVVARRPGDIAACYAQPEKAERLLGWSATRDLDDMCASAWKWQSENPQGYRSEE
ncbi:UDP-glucose 4-epimerase GalE [Xinfangfangia sp. D13-10-4-6]|uniref:UDP-glucose 4-epimerase GalE n=1 Tax=Pseudogemmobacter hezensis TaxID=2737662 RepID=UPI001551D262|nr:UDP-glucose 4-epimerase GalE [Pseudogemmobacter hezensis]NPD15518.1 UDP-glucose 4-epimerase GalE [Pseudogemmobacter hezensis]